MIFGEETTIPSGVRAIEPQRFDLMVESLVSGRLARRIMRAAEAARDRHIAQEEDVRVRSHEAEDSQTRA